MRSARRLLLVLLLGACVAPPPDAPPPGGVGPQGAVTEGGDTVSPAESLPPLPAAHAPVRADIQPAGTLNWAELSVRMVGRESSAGLRIDITTLNDEALAVAAPDIRAYLTDLKSRIPATDFPEDQAQELTLFMVGYTGFEKQVSFDPTLLLIHSEGSTFYPRAIVPISTHFDRRLVDLYETVYGIYLFDPGIDLVATLEFRYGELSSGTAWRGLVQRIQRAKARR
ncbi:MAG TPA: hypothetical protein VM737_12055 [Gemmatimonadota bacterium]|nr:hypothetical protein [Gemmatimonadota bacterium]